MLILSSPSGAGKTTLTRNLFEQDHSIRLSVSVTTRPAPALRDRRRALPLHRHRGFRRDARARRSARMGRGARQLLRHARAGRWSRRSRKAGTCCSTSTGRARVQIVEKMRADVVSVFVLPPSMAELKARLERRAEDAPEVIARRLANARDEIAHWSDLRLRARQRRPPAHLRRVEGDPRGGTAAAGASVGAGRVSWRRFWRRRAKDLPRRRSRAHSPARRSRRPGSSSARAVSGEPGRGDQGGCDRARGILRLCRSILRRWPKAARVTASSARTPAGQGVAARLEVHDARRDLWRRHEGGGRHVEEDARPRAPAGEHAEAAVVRSVAAHRRRCARRPRAGTSA